MKFRGLSLDELNGKGQKGIITQFVPISIIIKSFPFWKHLRGKDYSLDDFEVDPASVQEEVEFYMRLLSENVEKAKHGDLPMPFEDYVKNVIRLIGAEEQIRGEDFTLDFEKIVNRAPEHAEELADICLRFRKTGKMGLDQFFQELKGYLDLLERKPIHLMN